MELVHLVQIHLVQIRPLGTVHRHRWRGLGGQLHTRGVSGNGLYRSQRVDMDSAPSQSKHLQEGSEGSTSVDQDRGMRCSRDIEPVIFVSQTPREELRKRLQAKEEELSKLFGRPGVKIIERASTALENLLYSKNPYSQMVCGRPECHV